MKIIKLLSAIVCISALVMTTACGKEESKPAPAAKEEKAKPAKPEAEKPQAEKEVPAQPVTADPKTANYTPAQIASYNMGLRMGLYTFQNKFTGMDIEALKLGLIDGTENQKPRFTEEQMKGALDEIAKMRQQEQVEAAQKNQEAGIKFLEENGKRQGVVTTESGLQYEILTQGTGPSPKETDTVKTHYRGTLTDGSQFDSSYDRGQPATFPLNRVIPGWTEALQLMKVGGKWKVYVPSKLAYGERSPSPKIPANSVLVFDIELLEIVDNKPAPKPAAKPEPKPQPKTEQPKK